MTRVDARKVNKDDKMKYLDLLWTSIAELKSRDEVKNFFKDLLSESEAIMISRRIMIAKLLLEDRPYEEIQKIMKASRGTIAGVHRWLVSGFGGYENAVLKFEKKLEQRLGKSEDRYPESFTFSFDWLRKKYPLHFLLVNLLLDSGKKSKKLKKP